MGDHDAGRGVPPLALTDTILQRLATGRLPKDECVASWNQPGRGEVCVVCDRRILGQHRAVHCDFPNVRTWIFHQACHELWYATIKGEPPGRTSHTER